MKLRKTSFAIGIFIMLLTISFGFNDQKVSAYRPAPHYVVFCQNFITLRAAPSKSARAITRIPYGGEVTWCYGYNNGKAKNGFLKVWYGNRCGYALKKYLRQTSIYRVAYCKQYITLRKSPSTSARAITRIPLGRIVYKYGNSYNGFAKVNYRGKTGYVLKRYLMSW